MCVLCVCVVEIDVCVCVVEIDVCPTLPMCSVV